MQGDNAAATAAAAPTRRAAARGPARAATAPEARNSNHARPASSRRRPQDQYALLRGARECLHARPAVEQQLHSASIAARRRSRVAANRRAACRCPAERAGKFSSSSCWPMPPAMYSSTSYAPPPGSPPARRRTSPSGSASAWWSARARAAPAWQRRSAPRPAHAPTSHRRGPGPARPPAGGRQVRRSSSEDLRTLLGPASRRAAGATRATCARLSVHVAPSTSAMHRQTHPSIPLSVLPASLMRDV